MSYRCPSPPQNPQTLAADIFDYRFIKCRVEETNKTLPSGQVIRIFNKDGSPSDVSVIYYIPLDGMDGISLAYIYKATNEYMYMYVLQNPDWARDVTKYIGDHFTMGYHLKKNKFDMHYTSYSAHNGARHALYFNINDKRESIHSVKNKVCARQDMKCSVFKNVIDKLYETVLPQTTPYGFVLTSTYIPQSFVGQTFSFRPKYGGRKKQKGGELAAMYDKTYEIIRNTKFFQSMITSSPECEIACHAIRGNVGLITIFVYERGTADANGQIALSCTLAPTAATTTDMEDIHLVPYSYPCIFGEQPKFISLQDMLTYINAREQGDPNLIKGINLQTVLNATDFNPCVLKQNELSDNICVERSQQSCRRVYNTDTQTTAFPPMQAMTSAYGGKKTKSKTKTSKTTKKK